MVSLHADEISEANEEKETKHKLIEKAITELVAEEKLILTLYYYEENSVEQISKTTGLTVSNVKVKLFRLRNKLKEIAERISNTEIAVY
jgi:RNA polymerase sigma-70 factor (ECF subfamily)